MNMDKTQLLDTLAKQMRRGTLQGTLGLKQPEDRLIVKNSFNSLPDEPKRIAKLIRKTVEEAKVNSTKTNAQIAEMAKERGNKGYMNTKFIDWPPTR